MKSFVFLMLWTSATGLFAWLGLNRLAAARATGRFEYLWHGIGEASWPLLFSALKVFLTIFIGLACVMTAIGCVLLVKAFVVNFK